MELAIELKRALDGISANGALEVRENGEWLAGLAGLQYDVRSQGDAALLHLWSTHESLVRRVMRLGEESSERVVVEVARLGHSRLVKLEFVSLATWPDTKRVDRAQFRERMRQILLDRFPDETIDSLVTTADLHRSLSGSYTRGVTRRGSEAHAVLAASPSETAATLDGILTFGLIWLDHIRGRAKRYSVSSLRLFLPRETSAVVAHRMTALGSPHEVELYEYDPLHWRIHRISISDAGNLTTSIVPRREIDQALAIVEPEAERIRRLAPDAIRMSVTGTAENREVALRFRGLEFARWKKSVMWFGLADHQKVLTPERWPVLEALVRQLDLYRNPAAAPARHRFYSAQPERWLETIVTADPGRIDARLDATHIYTQVPALSSGDRGIIDLLGVTREGRLAVVELKADEDIQLVLQAVDYWIRVRWHQSQNDFRRYGYFQDVALQDKPPLLLLVAPGFQFHPSSDILLRYLSPQIEVVRVAVSENWRRSLKVVFRR